MLLTAPATSIRVPRLPQTKHTLVTKPLAAPPLSARAKKLFSPAPLPGWSLEEACKTASPMRHGGLPTRQGPTPPSLTAGRFASAREKERLAHLPQTNTPSPPRPGLPRLYPRGRKKLFAWGVNRRDAFSFLEHWIFRVGCWIFSSVTKRARGSLQNGQPSGGSGGPLVHHWPTIAARGLPLCRRLSTPQTGNWT